jgi:hypothetical protein
MSLLAEANETSQGTRIFEMFPKLDRERCGFLFQCVRCDLKLDDNYRVVASESL